MGRKYNYVDIDFAVRVLNHPELIDDEEMRLWLRDEGHCRLLEELRRVREGSLRTVDGLRPDVNLEWEKLSRKLFRKRILRVYRIAMATACIGILISVGWLWSRPSPVMQEDLVMVPVEEDHVESEGVTLVLNDGEEICLNRENQALLMQRLPQTFKVLSTDSLGGLVYTPRQLMGKSEELHTLKVPRGGEYFLTLADGTEVWLNAETEIRYPVQFTGDKRVVYLDGEAYFTVAPDKNKPFTVVSTHASVSVLGTQFNFRAYPDERDVQTTLVSGSVIMQSEKYKQQIKLVPGEQGVLEKNSAKLMKQEVNTYLYTAWKDGRFAFRDARLEDLFNILARWYDLSVFYQSPEAKDIRFTGDLNKTDDFKSILKIIEQNERVIFTVNQRTVFIQAK